jgi:ribosomal-protein-alanine N-acetyltransferase
MPQGLVGRLIRVELSISRKPVGDHDATVNGLVLRACQYQDLDQVLAVETAAFPDGPYTRLDFVSFLLRAGEGFMVACQDDSVVGYVIAMGRGGDGLIQSLAVSPEFRMRRIGEALMTAALNYLAKRYDRVYLQVDVSNENAILLYHKLLFRETGNRIRGYYPNGDDAIEMVRNLKDSTSIPTERVSED